MTNNILDVLTYMFDYLFELDNDSDNNEPHEIDDTALKAHLSQAGFDARRIDKALSWLEDIAAFQDARANPFAESGGSMRIYTTSERMKLDATARGFLLFMEDIGQLTGSQREMVINQVMTLDEPNLSLDDLKWIVMMVLSNDDSTIDSDATDQWLESLIFSNPKDHTLH